MTDNFEEIIQELKTEIYIALFGHNFVNVERLVPADDSKVTKILTRALRQQRRQDAEEFEKMIGKDQQEPSPDEFFVVDGLDHFAIAKGRNVLRAQLRKQLETWRGGEK